MRALPTLRRLSKGTLLVLISAFAAFSQIPSKVDRSATVKGRVTSNGRGVAGCAVMMWNPLFNEPPAQGTHTEKTDRDGNFRITAPPGNYYVWVSLPGFFVVDDGKPSQQLRASTLSAGEELDEVNFEVERGGVITGKGTSHEDKPLIETRV